ncbi:MAG: glycine cleavage system protein GcvH [Jatrophihabitans sp.]
MAEIPSDLRYTAEHEWAKLTSGNTLRVGITDYAQNSLGDIVFVSVHGLDSAVTAGDTFGEVESTKSVSDLYAPVAGRVVRRNEDLDDKPELLNSDPYGAGWIAEIEVDDVAVLDTLLDAQAYQDATAE